MKNTLLFLIGFALVLKGGTASAQPYCTPTVDNYGPSTPGITNVKVADINRTSATLEDYINTGILGHFKKGGNESISITYTIDMSICPNMNIRVWLDLNMDSVFQTNEMVVSKDYDASYKYNALINIPLTATDGRTRMRVAVKMSDDGGHTPPTPCNLPPDPLDFHGEIEDYYVQISGIAGIVESPEMNTAQLFPNPAKDKLFLNLPEDTKFEITDISGRIMTIESEGIKGINSISLNEFPPGLYFARVITLSFNRTFRFVRQ